MTAKEYGSGKWRVFFKHPETGKRTSITVHGSTKQYALSAGEAALRDLKCGVGKGDTPTFSQAAIRVLESGSRREVTVAQYEKCIRLYIAPLVGDEPIDRIDGRKLEQGICRLAAPTRKMVRAVTKTIVREAAMLWEVDCLDPYRFVKVRREIRQRHDVGAPLADLRKMAREGSLEFRLAINAGLRPAELRGLKVEDVEGDKIHVRRSRSFVRGQYANELPKTGRVRRVPIGHSLASDLASHVLDSNLDGGRYVFKVPHPSTWNKNLRTECERLGIARLRPYDLRHGCAILLARSGASILEIAKHLGHEQTSTTEIYLGSDAATEGVVVEA